MQAESPTIVVTRPLAQAECLAAELHVKGLATQCFPLLEITPVSDAGPLQAALAKLESFALVVFVSPNAIEHALAHLQRPWPAAVPIAVVGPGSVRALAKRGIVAPAVRIYFPSASAAGVVRYDSEALLATLVEQGMDASRLQGKPVLLIRGNGGRELLSAQLRRLGAELTVVEAYRRMPPQPDAEAWQAIRALLARPHAWLLTSSEAVRNLMILAEDALPAEELAKLRQSKAFAPHARIVESAREMGFENVCLTGAGDDQLLEAVCAWATALRRADQQSVPVPAVSGHLTDAVSMPAAAPAPAATPIDPVVLTSAMSSSTPSASSAPPPSVPHGKTGTERDPMRSSSWLLGLLLALVPSVLAVFWMQHRLADLSEELAKRLQASDLGVQEARLMANANQGALDNLQAKMGNLEARLNESRDKQLALEQLYQDLGRNRDDWLIAEIDQILTTATQQLQLTGNVQVALTALQNADARLAGMNKPQFTTVRRALAHDIDRLKALPAVDLAGAAIQLDEALLQVDTLPLLAGERESGATEGKKRQGPLLADKTGQTWLAEWADRIWAAMRYETEQLVSVRRVNEPPALLASPEQSWFLRENLKLRLLNARLALLSRNEAAFRGDLEAVQEMLRRYFDVKSRKTVLVQTLVRQAQANAIAIDLPTLAESLAAVRNYRKN